MKIVTVELYLLLVYNQNFAGSLGRNFVTGLLHYNVRRFIITLYTFMYTMYMPCITLGTLGKPMEFRNTGPPRKMIIPKYYMCIYRDDSNYFSMLFNWLIVNHVKLNKNIKIPSSKFWFYFWYIPLWEHVAMISIT